MIVFVVVGRLGKSLVVSKVVPFTSLKFVNKVYIFSQEKGFFIENAEYIVHPKWLLKIKPFLLRKIIRSFYEPLQLLFYTLKIKPTLINGVFTLPKGLYATIVGKITNTPSVVSVIGGIVEIRPNTQLGWLLEKLIIWMLNTCTIVTTKGNAVSEYLRRKGVVEDKIFTLNGSINIERFIFNAKIEKDIDILFVGNFRNLKGPDRVIKVVELLLNDFPHIRSVLVGDGKLFKSINKYVTDYDLNSQVLLPGYISDPLSFFQRSKCILIPSRSEGLPTCMLEAMACGCVPIVSDVGNIKEAAIHGENAFLIADYMDTEKFAEYAKYLLKNETARINMAEEGVKIVNLKYAPAKQAKIVNEIINKILAT